MSLKHCTRLCKFAINIIYISQLEPVKDQYNREFKTLRLSLTDVCNLGCVYCMPLNIDNSQNETSKKTARTAKSNLSTENLIKLVGRLHQILDLKTLRLTGGEPLLSSQLIPVLNGIKDFGIPAVKMTTNGFLLEDKARALKEGGISSINISLDAINQQTFEKISQRRNLDKIIRGIDLAINLGIPVKLNAVIMKGMNEQEIIPLFEFAKSRNIQIRFLELMKMGHLHNRDDSPVFSEAEILTVLASQYNFKQLPRASSATANLWRTADDFTFGIIANESSPFCTDCDRLRIDSEGNMYGCLSSNIPIRINNEESAEEWDKKLKLALSHKQLLSFTGSELSMIEIGG